MMRTARITLSIITALFSINTFASDKSYQLPITRNGKTTTRVAHNYWAGEYPSPVINVQTGGKGNLIVKGYKSLRKLNEPVKCSIKKGLYHPWSKTGNSVITYYTIGPRNEIKATKNTQLDDYKIRKGQTIKNIMPAGEGYCNGLLNGKEISYFCDNADSPDFVETIPSDEKWEQWLYVKCRQGYNAFIQDKALLKYKNITKGKVESYGKVTP